MAQRIDYTKVASETPSPESGRHSRCWIGSGVSASGRLTGYGRVCCSRI